MDTMLLQDWTTISGKSTVVQTRTAWLDVSAYADATFWLDVRETTGSPGGSVTLTYETSPTTDEVFFQPIAIVPTLAASTTPVVTRAMLYGSPKTPIARFVRWKLTGTTSGLWDVTFRVFVTLGRGAPGAWKPTMIPGCILWLRADQGVTVVSGRVSAWSDQSGTGNNFSQGNSANQPAYVATDVNSQPVMSFDSTRPDYLIGPSLLAAGFSGLTIAAVTNFTTKTNFGMIVAQNALDELREHLLTGELQLATQGLDTCIGSVDRSNTWLVAIGRHDGATNALEVRKGKLSEATAASGGALGNALLALGARWDGTSATFPFTGKIAEAVIWNRQLTIAECNQYADYAIGRWALPVP